MTQDLHWNTPLISRSRTDVTRLFDGFTLVEPGLVPPRSGDQSYTTRSSMPERTTAAMHPS